MFTLPKIMLTGKVGRIAGKAGLKLAKASPQITFVAGVIFMGATIVVASKQTLKLTEIMEEAHENLDAIHEAHEEQIDGYSEGDYKHDLTVTNAKMVYKVAVNYAPAVALGVMSIACFTTSHYILSKRVATFAMMYAASNQEFKDYRQKVIESEGKDKDLFYRHGITKETIEEENPETGEKNIKTEYVANDKPHYSVYARVFDETCPEYVKDSEYNRSFLYRREKEANIRLKAEGYLTLNDVYEMIGFPRTRAGQFVGWYYNEHDSKANNCVDFGLTEIREASQRRFMNGYERSFVLDFNVDGNILAYMPS